MSSIFLTIKVITYIISLIPPTLIIVEEIFMKKIIIAIIVLIAHPFVELFKAIAKLVESLFNIVLKIPADAFAAVTARLSLKPKKIDIVLDDKQEKSEKKKENKKLQSSLAALFKTDNLIGNAAAAKVVKFFVVVILEIVSFFTTLYGLYQCLSSISPVVPFLTAAVIQILLSFLCSKVGSTYVPKSYRALLAFIFAISIAFSYVGACYTLLPYQNYAKSVYGYYSSNYNSTVSKIKESTENYGEPVAEVKSMYNNITTILSEAETAYSKEVLSKAKNQLEEYKNRKQAVTEQQPVSYMYDENGSVITYGGGTIVTYVPDSKSVSLIKQAEKNVKSIEETISLIQIIQKSLLKECKQKTVINAIKNQLNNTNKLNSEFIEVNRSFNSLCSNVSKLANKTNASFDEIFDLETVVSKYNKNVLVNSLSKLPLFSDELQKWQKNQQFIFHYDGLSDFVTVYDYSALTEKIESDVENSYERLNEISKTIDYDISSLDKAYNDFQLMSPLVYSFSSLYPFGEKFGTALIALFIAFLIDGTAVIVGIYLEHRNMNWVNESRNNCCRAKYVYTQFKATMMPMLTRLVDSSSTPDLYYKTFITTLSEYLDRFELSSCLINTEFSRFYIGKISEMDFKNFCSFLVMFDLAKIPSKEEIISLGIISSEETLKDKQECILLTERGEMWLMDHIGSASDEIVKLIADIYPADSFQDSSEG